MKIAAIKSLVSEHNLEVLKQAEEALLNEQKPFINIEGDDEGEQLTHVMAAIEIGEHISGGMKANDALRAFTRRVRKSIS